MNEQINEGEIQGYYELTFNKPIITKFKPFRIYAMDKKGQVLVVSTSYHIKTRI